MKKVYNFSTAPTALPEQVVEKIKSSFDNYKKSGMAVAELPSTSREYKEIFTHTENLLRELMNIPQNYKVIFMQGNSAAQHSAIPLNLLSDHKCADYVVTGQVSKNASIEAKKYGDIAIAASSAGAMPTFSTVPEMKRSDFRPDADYVYISYNNTIYGTKFTYVPDTGNIPLVADMSSVLLTEPIELSKFGLIYANAECGFGVPGLTVVILREDLLSNARASTPSILNLKKNDSDYILRNTASVFSVYVAMLVFEWIKSLGGVEGMKSRNYKKASLIYDYLDTQTYYTAPVDKKCRSTANVVFVTGDAALDKKFIKEAKAEGLINLAGHSSLGGMNAAISNAMPYEALEKLVAFMKKFAQTNLKLDN